MATTALQQAVIRVVPAGAAGVPGAPGGDYPTRAAAIAATIPPEKTVVRLGGYHVAGDGGGGATYTRFASEPADGEWFQETGGAWYRLSDPMPTILQLGGKAEPGFDNGPAALRAKGYERVRFPGAPGTAYAFTTLTDLLGFTVDPDPGVRFEGLLNFYPGLRTTRATQLRRVDAPEDPRPVDYEVPAPGRQLLDKEGHFVPGTLDRSRVLGLDPGSDLFFQAFPVGDTAFADDHAPDAADAQALNDYVAYWDYNFVNDGRMRYGATVVRVGDEVSAVFSEGAFSRCLILLCTEGWTAFMTDAVVDNGRILTKLIGQPGVLTTGVTWDGNTTQANYAAGNVSWGAQIRSPNSWMLRLAGKDGFVQPLTTPGDIIAVGWGSIGIDTRTIRISYPTRTRNAEAAGTRGSIVGFSGDSQLDPGIVGNAIDWAAHFLDLELGGRVFLTVNRAVSGQNSAEQMTKLLAEGTGGASFWFIDACTNDIQGGPSAAPHDTLFNYKAMCDYLEAQSCRPSGSTRR